MTEKELELIKLIGADGEYDYGLPDDDLTINALTSLYLDGFIDSNSSRVGDFIFLTKAGIEKLNGKIEVEK